MSAFAPRGQRGGSNVRGSRGSATPSQSFRGSARGSATSPARGRGRGRGGAPSSGGEGLLQKLRTGTVTRGSDNGATPGGRGESQVETRENNSLTSNTGRGNTRASASFTPRGRGNLTKTFNNPSPASSPPQSRAASPAPSSLRDFMDNANTRFQSVSPSPFPVG